MSRTTKIGIGVTAVLLIVLVAFVGGGFYFSNLIREGAFVVDREEEKFTLEVAAVGDGRITLRMTDETDKDGDWRRKGIYGLESEQGYNRLGEILELTDDQVVREFTHFNGEELVTGQMVRVDPFAYPGDPLTAHGIPFEEVTYSSPVGDLTAWFIDGPLNTWAIFVHGRTANSREALRLLPAVVDEDFPSMVIDYRNDIGAPTDPSNFYQFGLTEWEDLEGAATYALENGAENLILVGYSMGGGIVTNFLYQSPLAEKVEGAVFDAPMLDFGETVDLGVRENGYPAVIGSIAKLFAGFRFGVDWENLNYLKRADELDVPILLFHGDSDQTVPVETSDTLAEARPDIVHYIRVSDTRHVRAWNTERAAYEQAVRDFLRELTE